MRQVQCKKVWDLEICRNINKLKDADKIIIYGAAEKGREIFGWLEDADLKIDFFCDRNMSIWGNYFEDTEIISPFKLRDISIENEGASIFVIACVLHPQEILTLFNHLGLNNIKVITYWGIRVALRVNKETLYEQQSKRMLEIQIENQQRKNSIIIWAYKLLYDLITSSKKTIWIVQPGKMATSSLESRMREKQISFIKEHILEFPDFVLSEEYRRMWEEKIQEQKNDSLKVLAAVREPLSRDYSAFWQVFSEIQERMLISSILDKDFQKMYENYVDLILKGRECIKEKMGVSLEYTWNDEFEWFDEQIKKYLGIDVYEYPFNPDEGYTIIKKGNIELFLYKVEKMEAVLDKISSFIGTTKLSSVNSNVSAQKWYGLAYVQFRKEVKLPKRYVEHYYVNNKKMDHFYTEEEKKEFLDKWKDNIEDGIVEEHLI